MSLLSIYRLRFFTEYYTVRQMIFPLKLHYFFTIFHYLQIKDFPHTESVPGTFSRHPKYPSAKNGQFLLELPIFSVKYVIFTSLHTFLHQIKYIPFCPPKQYVLTSRRLPSPYAIRLMSASARTRCRKAYSIHLNTVSLPQESDHPPSAD